MTKLTRIMTAGIFVVGNALELFSQQKFLQQKEKNFEKNLEGIVNNVQNQKGIDSQKSIVKSYEISGIAELAVELENKGHKLYGSAVGSSVGISVQGNDTSITVYPDIYAERIDNSFFSSELDFYMILLQKSPENKEVVDIVNNEYRNAFARFYDADVPDSRQAVIIDSTARNFTPLPSGIGADKHNMGLPPQLLQLMGNYPNPFNNSTKIRYELGEAANVSMEVYDITGRRIETRNLGNHGKGTHEIEFFGYKNIGYKELGY